MKTPQRQAEPETDMEPAGARGSTPIRRWADLSLSLRILLVLAGACAPWLLYAALLQSLPGDVGGGSDLVAWCGVCLVALADGRFAGEPESGRSASIIAPLAALVYVAAWSGLTRLGWAQVLFAFLAAFALVRSRRMGRTESLIDEGARQLRLDIVGILVVVVLLLLTRHSAREAAPDAVDWPIVWIPLCATLYLALRLRLQWVLERLAYGNPRRAQPVVVAGIGLLALAVFFGPGLVFRTAEHLWLYLANAIVRFVLPGLAWLFAHVPLGFHIHRLHKAVHHDTGNTATHAHTQLPVTAPSYWVTMGLRVLVLAAVVAAIYWLWRRQTARSSGVEEKHLEDVQVVRAWLPRREGLQFVATRHPVRLQFQAWLRAQAERRRAMTQSETARGYAADVAAGDAAAQALARAYEMARYGEDDSTQVDSPRW